MALVECVANFSEGRREPVVEAIVDAIGRKRVLDVGRDADHNRCVITFAGTPEEVGEAAVEAVGAAARHIDMNEHSGVHPRIGAADVIPFVPLRDITLIECDWLAQQVGAEIWNRFSIPVYLYEAAAQRRERRDLANVRKGQFEGLREAVLTDANRLPDFGNAALHPTAGAVAVGARKILIAWNLLLSTEDVELARAIARRVRERDGGFTCVKALGLYLASRGLAQISVNLTDFEVTQPHTVFEAVERLAAESGARIVSTELIGLIPRAAMERAAEYGVDLKIENWSDDRILENRLIAAGLQ